MFLANTIQYWDARVRGEGGERPLSEATVKTYKSQARAIEVAAGQPYDTMSVADIIAAGEKAYPKESTRKMALSAAKVVLDQNNRRAEGMQLMEYYKTLDASIATAYRERHVEKSESLPSYEEATRYMWDELENGNLRHFLVQYLMLEFAIRNKDANVFVYTGNKKGSKVEVPVPEEGTNWIDARRGAVTLHIGDYKTRSKFGAKAISITNKKAIAALRSPEIANTWLISSGAGASKPPEAYVRKFLMPRDDGSGLTWSEGDYCKIVIDHVRCSPNAGAMLEYISKTRGTDIGTLIKSYDVTSGAKAQPLV